MDQCVGGHRVEPLPDSGQSVPLHGVRGRVVLDVPGLDRRTAEQRADFFASFSSSGGCSAGPGNLTGLQSAPGGGFAAGGASPAASVIACGCVGPMPTEMRPRRPPTRRCHLASGLHRLPPRSSSRSRLCKSRRPMIADSRTDRRATAPDIRHRELSHLPARPPAASDSSAKRERLSLCPPTAGTRLTSRAEAEHGSPAARARRTIGAPNC